MCDVCHATPCDPRCPNAPDPPAVYTCKYCGEPIVPGDEYMEVDGDYYHLEDCAGDAALSILKDQFGARTGVAEVDRWYKRLKKVLDAWGKNYDKYFDALTKKPEADYARAKIDAAMKLICGDSQDFIPFEQRYEWLPEIRYDRRG